MAMIKKVYASIIVLVTLFSVFPSMAAHAEEGLPAVEQNQAVGPGYYDMEARIMLFSSKTDFFSKTKAGAIEGWKKYKILPSITEAQAILESGWGESGLTREANNLFGIKGSYNGQSVMYPTREVINGQSVMVNAAFRKYPSWDASLEDHGKFLGVDNPRYSNLIGEKDYKKVAQMLQQDGYATDPNYANSLIGIIESNNLQSWDQEAFVVPNNKTYYTNDSVALRTKNGWDNPIAVTIPRGDKVTIDLNSAVNGWYKVSYSGNTGYMLLNYFSDSPTIKTSYAKNVINLRSKATWDSSILKEVPKGAKVIIQLQTNIGDWYKVEYGGVTGYMPLAYFSDNQVTKFYYAKNEISLRSKATWDSSTVSQIPKGERVTVDIQSNNDGWYELETRDGKVGYIPLSYLSDKEVVKVYYALDAVNLRSTPSWESNTVVTVPVGYAAQVDIQTNQGDWYEVTFQGNTGWIPIKYFSADRYFDDYTANDAINFRSDRKWDSSVVASCVKGATISVIKNSNVNGWVEIMYQGTRGFIPVQYLTQK
ncbi:SH3 domain-containing protein [Listeria booriae]|nr:SH3 domain-containing protein [Listeria booriae]